MDKSNVSLENFKFFVLECKSFIISNFDNLIYLSNLVILNYSHKNGSFLFDLSRSNKMELKNSYFKEIKLKNKIFNIIFSNNINLKNIIFEKIKLNEEDGFFLEQNNSLKIVNCTITMELLFAFSFSIRNSNNFLTLHNLNITYKFDCLNSLSTFERNQINVRLLSILGFFIQIKSNSKSHSMNHINLSKIDLKFNFQECSLFPKDKFFIYIDLFSNLTIHKHEYIL